VLGFLSVLAIFASVTMVSYGVLPRQDLANTHPPSMAAVLESVVGSWGSTFISIGVIISVQGAYLAWTLINAEVLYMPARTAVMPKFLARNNKNNTPIAALITTNVAVQALLVTVLFVRDALDFMIALDTALSLVPYLFAAGYALKLTITRETYGAADESERRRQQIVAVAAVLYSIFLLYAAGLKYLLVASIVYAPGTFLYIWARREQGGRVFQLPEAVLCVVLVVAAVVGIILISTGYLAL
jgi:arginine:ornithine antiporter/lysine permease